MTRRLTWLVEWEEEGRTVAAAVQLRDGQAQARIGTGVPLDWGTFHDEDHLDDYLRTHPTYRVVERRRLGSWER